MSDSPPPPERIPQLIDLIERATGARHIDRRGSMKNGVDDLSQRDLGIMLMLAEHERDLSKLRERAAGVSATIGMLMLLWVISATLIAYLFISR